MPSCKLRVWVSGLLPEAGCPLVSALALEQIMLSSSRGLGRLIFFPAVLTGQRGSDGTPFHQHCMMDGWWLIKTSLCLPPSALARETDDGWEAL